MKKIIGRPKEYIYLILGNALFGLAFNLFFRTNDIAAGGFGGLGMVINYYLPWVSIGMVVFIISIPVFIWSLLVEGGKYTLSALISTAVYSFFIDVFAAVPNVTDNLFMAAVCGGAMNGLAAATLVRGRVSGSGTDLLGRLLITRFRVLTLGTFVMMADVVVVVSSVLTFGNLETGVYSGLAIVTCSIVTDWCINGFNRAYLFQVITSVDAAYLSKQIHEQLDRGATLVQVKGTYSFQDKNMLMVVVSPRQVYEMKDLIKKYAPDAFVTLISSKEVIGEGFEGVDVTVPVKELDEMDRRVSER